MGSLLPLRVHLRLCALCARYQSQTHLIARVARYPADYNAVRLRESFKARLREQLRPGTVHPPRQICQ